MQNILDYGSDRDSNCEEPPVVKSAVSKHNSDNHVSNNSSISSSCNVKSSESNTIKAGGNFFGLDSMPAVSRNYNNHDISVAISEPQSRVVTTSSGELEIPGGDFWKDFCPDKSQILDYPSQTSHDEYFNKQTSNTFLPKEQYSTFADSSQMPKDRENKRKHQVEDDPYRTSSSKIERQSGLPKKPGDCSTADCLTQREEGGKRKIFYVHGKVMPFLHSSMKNTCARYLESTWSAHSSAVNRVVWNTEHFSHLLLTAGMDCQVKVWNPWSSVGRCLVTLCNHNKAVRHVEWCLQGRSALSCSYDCTAKITDIETERVRVCCEHTSHVTAGCIHPVNANLLVTGVEDALLLWDMRTPEAPVKYFSHKDKFGLVQDILFIQDGQELISCSDLVSRDSADRTIIAWDVRSGVVLSNQIYQERYTCTRLKLHPTKTQFLAQTNGGYVALFSSSKPYKMEKARRFQGQKIYGYNIGFDISSDGSLVYSGSAEGGVHCFDFRTGRLIKKLTCGGSVVVDVSAHPVLPSILACCTWGGNLYLWQ